MQTSPNRLVVLLVIIAALGVLTAATGIVLAMDTVAGRLTAGGLAAALLAGAAALFEART